MNMNKLAPAILAACAMTGLAACGSTSTSDKDIRASFLKGCQEGAPSQFSKQQITNFCNCSLDEMKKRGLDTVDEVKKAQSGRTPDYVAAVRVCSQKYLSRGY